MKADPSESRVRDRMRPGVLSRDGFLGSDPRNIGDIVAEDMAELEGMGVTREEIADLFERIHRAVDQSPETPVRLCGGRIIAEATEVMGRIPCPFACGFRAHKAVITVRTGDRVLRITPIGIHLIGRHGFFQGRGAPFRIEPRDAAALVLACRGND